MSNAYRRSVLAPRERVIFDPSNNKHMLDFAKFVKYNSWREGCRYYLEDPFMDIPTMIRSKIADYTLSKLVVSHHLKQIRENLRMARVDYV